MTNVNVTLKGKRTFVYRDSFFQTSIDGGTNTETLKFIQDWGFTPSMDDFDIDKIDTAEPIFTPKSDIVGDFDFLYKNTIDVVETVNPPVDGQSLSSWVLGIAAGEPVTITFIIILTAVKDGFTNHGFVTYQFTGRIMRTPLVQTRDTGVQEQAVEGEITSIVKVQRTAGSN